MKTCIRGLFLLLCLGLAGCQTPPVDDATARLRALSPDRAAADPALYQGQQVEWGGVLVDIFNRPQHTLLEVMSYSLNAAGAPDTAKPPQGRFFAKREGFLDPVEFAPGREITVTGAINGSWQGQRGNEALAYPLVEAQAVRLWRKDQRSDSPPRIQFGIGVGFGL